jgi:hypothetical protein
MNREYLLDSLDGLKALIFRLLPVGVAGSIACVPMTTDGPWTNAEKAVFETALGIPQSGHSGAQEASLTCLRPVTVTRGLSGATQSPLSTIAICF